MIPFAKFSGCGNDFILIDNRSHALPYHSFSLRSLCDRRQGVGADGIIFLENSQKADYRMRIFNADGGEAEMCGNGIRCLMQFLHALGEKPPVCLIETMLRPLQVEKIGDQISVQMATPLQIQWDLALAGFPNMHLLNTGVPHALLFVEDLEQPQWMEMAPKIRYHDAFAPNGVNVNFIKVTSSNTLHLRTYERGVEGETLACGTGATAAALAAAHCYQLKSPLQVIPRSQEALTLSFSWENGFPQNVRLMGPARQVFSGSLERQAFERR